MVEVKNLVKRYNGNLAVDDVNFDINEGEIVGFLGPNGAGKSTTMNIITGYIAATSGTVKINGFDIMKEPLKAKAQIGYLPEQPPLYLDMTVKGYLSFIYDLKKVKMNKSEHISEICERVEITDVYDRPIKKLSKGYKQRVGIAQALIGYPPLIILDEPTVGLDPKQLISIRNLIKSLAEKHTVIFSSHILHEVQMICDRIIVINSGKVVADDNKDNIYNGVSANKNIVAHVEGDKYKVLNVLNSIEGVVDVRDADEVEENVWEYIVNYESSYDIRKAVFKELALNNLPLIKLDLADANLEETFLKLTEKGNVEQKTEEEEIEDRIKDEIDEDIEEINEEAEGEKIEEDTKSEVEDDKTDEQQV